MLLILTTVNPNPVIDAGADFAVCDGDAVTLSGSGAGLGGTYTWDGGVTDGVAFTPAATTTYTVTGTDANGCEGTDDITVTVNPLPTVTATAVPDEICEDATLVLTGGGADTYVWDGGEVDGVSFTPGSTAIYTVTGTTAGGCTNTDDVMVTVHPLPEITFTADQLQGCAPFEINFASLTDGIAFEWAFGDGSTATGKTPSHVYSTAGFYDVTLTLTSPAGCENTVTYDNYIDIVPQPIAAFLYSPDDITVNDTEVDFTNESMYADSYIWDFGDGTGSEAEHPSHLYPAVGNKEYRIRLRAISDYGCEDMVEQYITIKDALLYFIPNTFTLDGNSFNDEFKPVFYSGIDIYNYHLMMFNRWGEMVFESYDATYGWDGTYGDMGLVEDGVYVWRIEFKETMSETS